MTHRAKHTGRSPASELPVEQVSSGEVINAKVKFEEKADPVTEEEWEGHKVFTINITSANFWVTMNFTDREYSGFGRWGDVPLREVREALEVDGYKLRCCYTCRFYSPAGMFGEWSLGTEAYCALTGGPRVDNLTHMLHICDHWSSRPDALGGNMGPVETKIRRCISAPSTLLSIPGNAPFKVVQMTNDHLVLSFGHSASITKFRWDCLEGVAGFLQDRGWVPIGARREAGFDAENPPQTLDQYLKSAGPRLVSGGYITRVLQNAKIVDANSTRPASVKLRENWNQL